MRSSSDPTEERPHIFVGSSTEGLRIANTLQVLLDYDCDVEVWSQGIFEPGGTTLASLTRASETVDFAVLVVSPDDVTGRRNEWRNTARDNVIFELGLFIGALGSNRTFMVTDRTKELDLPSDLHGVTSIKYAIHKSDNYQASLGAAATQLREAFRRSGPRRVAASPGAATATDRSGSQTAGDRRSSPALPQRPLAQKPHSEEDVTRAVRDLPASKARDLVMELLHHAKVHGAIFKGGTGRAPSAGFYFAVAGGRPSLWSLYVRPSGPAIALNFGSVNNVSQELAQAAFDEIEKSDALRPYLRGAFSEVGTRYPEIPLTAVADDSSTAPAIMRYLDAILR